MIATEKRIALLVQLGEYLKGKEEELVAEIQLAHRNNGWFTPEYVTHAIDQIAENYLEEHKLRTWLASYPVLDAGITVPKNVGIVMAGNIPLVGFHDFLCAFISGHNVTIKLSSKDTSLWRHILGKLTQWEPEFEQVVSVAEMLKSCDAYIATGSNNSARYFEYYFQKFPHIIRKNRSSVAILTGEEDAQMLADLADDVNIYFGFGCRNVSQIYVPQEYNFEALLSVFDKYLSHIDHNKFKNNYDYQLALYLLNKQYYMTNGHMLLVESESVYAPISTLHYQYYTNTDAVVKALNEDDQVQCITSALPVANTKMQAFGVNQKPGITDYSDGVDTMEWLSKL